MSDAREEYPTAWAYEQACKALDAAKTRAGWLEYYLRVFVHAHKNGNSVPPHLDAEARAMLATRSTKEPGE